MTTVGHDVAAELRAAGLAATTARRTVLGVLEGRQRPASAAEVHERLRRDGHRVGLTTVYRTLHALVEAGLLHTFHIGGEDTYRHCRFGPHHHLICQACGLVIERPADEIAALVDRIRAEAEFLPDPHHADLVGVCATCHAPTAATCTREREPERCSNRGPASSVPPADPTRPSAVRSPP